MLIVWKGASSDIELNDGQIAGVIIGTGLVVAGLSVLFLLPYVYRKLLKDDWQLQWYQFILGPLLLRRPDPPPRPADVSDIVDYYAGHKTREELDAAREEQAAINLDTEKGVLHSVEPVSDASSDEVTRAPATTLAGARPHHSSNIPARPEGPWHKPAVFFWTAQRIIFRGVEKDVVGAQSQDKTLLTGDLEKMHARAAHYDNRAEYMYSFLQVLTAATASFTHGSNDIAK